MSSLVWQSNITVNLSVSTLFGDLERIMLISSYNQFVPAKHKVDSSGMFKILFYYLINIFNLQV